METIFLKPTLASNPFPSVTRLPLPILNFPGILRALLSRYFALVFSVFSHAVFTFLGNPL
jgi:hypothetical protein